MHNKKRTKLKKKFNEKSFAMKMLLIIIHLIIITILGVYDYKLYQEDIAILPWNEVEETTDYTYIEISKMSEQFASYPEKNIGIHFVIEKEITGKWHTYLIAINEDDYAKYKDIIDYTYERTTTVPKPLKVYGYPVIVNSNLKTLAIKNLPNFVPADNEVVITDDNYEKYLTNSYLDTTKEKTNEFNMPLFIVSVILILTIISLLMTIFNIEIYHPLHISLRKRKSKKH